MDPQAEYTCPMHPEVVQKGPGICPICGMDLEIIGGHDGDDPEYKAMVRRLIQAALLALPVVVLSMTHFIPQLASNWIQFLLTSSILMMPGRFIF
jgi:Cu+-exporting ATPase